MVSVTRVLSKWHPRVLGSIPVGANFQAWINKATWFPWSYTFLGQALVELFLKKRNNRGGLWVFFATGQVFFLLFVWLVASCKRYGIKINIV
jgi:hypothetical protein